MRASAACRALIEHYEGRHAQAYPDPATKGAPWTIGVGHTGPDIVRGLVWTDEQIDAAFTADLLVSEGYCERAMQGRVVPQHQWDALVSIMFNVGPGRPDLRVPGRGGMHAGRDGILILRTGLPSTLVRRMLVGDVAGAADQFLAWDKAGGKSMRGLRRRRAAERALFLGHTVEDAIAAGEAVK